MLSVTAELVSDSPPSNSAVRGANVARLWLRSGALAVRVRRRILLGCVLVLRVLVAATQLVLTSA